jgi:hypothetical protein
VASLTNGRLVVLNSSDLRADGSLLPARPGVMEQLRVSSDGRLVAARGEDGRVRLVDVSARAQVGDAMGLTEGVPTAVSLHPEGDSVLLGGAQQVVEWELRPGRLVRAACQLAGRGLSRQEWATHVGDLAAYDPTCRPA